jgi:hypothetical protein
MNQRKLHLLNVYNIIKEEIAYCSRRMGEVMIRWLRIGRQAGGERMAKPTPLGFLCLVGRLKKPLVREASCTQWISESPTNNPLTPSVHSMH